MVAPNALKAKKLKQPVWATEKMAAFPQAPPLRDSLVELPLRVRLLTPCLLNAWPGEPRGFRSAFRRSPAGAAGLERRLGARLGTPGVARPLGARLRRLLAGCLPSGGGGGGGAGLQRPIDSLRFPAPGLGWGRGWGFLPPGLRRAGPPVAFLPRFVLRRPSVGSLRPSRPPGSR